MLTELELVDLLSSRHASIEFLSDEGLETQHCRVYFDDEILSLSFRLLHSFVLGLSIDWASSRSGMKLSTDGRCLHFGMEGAVDSESLGALVGVVFSVIRQLSVN